MKAVSGEMNAQLLPRGVCPFQYFRRLLYSPGPENRIFWGFRTFRVLPWFFRQVYCRWHFLSSFYSKHTLKCAPKESLWWFDKVTQVRSKSSQFFCNSWSVLASRQEDSRFNTLCIGKIRESCILRHWRSSAHRPKNPSKHRRATSISKYLGHSAFCLDCSPGSLKTTYGFKDSSAKGLAVKPGLECVS